MNKEEKLDAVAKVKEQSLAIIEPSTSQIQKVEHKVISMLDQAGTIEFTEEQQNILFAPIDPEIVEIRPDGLIYAPAVEYRERFRNAFRGKYAIIPETTKIRFENNLMLWGFYLMLDGKPYAFAIGQQEYHESNPNMTYGDAIEGCKSNALMRLAKDIGMFPELWRPSFVKAWKEKYAESHWDDKKGKYLWRKKDDVPEDTQSTPPFKNSSEKEGEVAGDRKTQKQRVGSNPASPSPTPATSDKEETIAKIKKFIKDCGEDEREFKAWLAEKQGNMNREYIGLHYNNWSFNKGKEKDLAHLFQTIGTAMLKYQDYKIKAKKEENNE